MAESIEEYFADDNETISPELREAAKLVKGFLQGHKSASDTAQDLTTQSETQTESIIETCIVSVAEQLPATHDALVELTMQMRNQEQQNINGIDDAVGKFDHYVAYSIEERSLRYGDPDPMTADRAEERQEWTNLNHLAALLYAAGLRRLWSIGEQVLDMTLRRKGWRVNWTGPENTSDEIVALRGHADAAAQWIVIAGQRLYDDSDLARAKWSTWLADVAWIAAQDDLYDETRALCRQAQTVMEAIHT